MPGCQRHGWTADKSMAAARRCGGGSRSGRCPTCWRSSVPSCWRWMGHRGRCGKALCSWPLGCQPPSGSLAAPAAAPRAAAYRLDPHPADIAGHQRRAGGCWCAAATTVSWPSPPAGSSWDLAGWAGPGRRSRTAWSRSRLRLAWTTTRSVGGRAGIATSPGPAGPCLPGLHPLGRQSRAHQGEHRLSGGLGLLPLTVPEVRRLLVALGWTTPVRPGFVLAWSRWRRRIQSATPR